MSLEPRAPAENLIVGGGVIGLAVAYELLRRGRKVLMLEQERPGMGSTAAAGGMLAPISEAELEEPEVITFGLDSLARYPGFVKDLEKLTGLSCRYRTEGTLWVALNRDDRAELDHLKATLEGKGLAAQSLGSEELRQLEPHLSNRVLGGLLVAGDHQIDPRALSRCLERAVRVLHGQILTGMQVDEVLSQEQGFAVRGRRGDGCGFDLKAERVIVAAGAGSREGGLRLPIGRFGLRPVKGQLMRLRGPRLLDHVVRTPDVYLIPRADGELLVGATMEEMGFSTSPTAGAVMDLLRHGWEALPGIYDLDLDEVSVGLRSAVDDHLPVIGRSEIDGLFLATGHFRNGVLLAPATAHYLAQWIVEGREPEELGPFTPERLVQGATRGD